ILFWRPPISTLFPYTTLFRSFYVIAAIGIFVVMWLLVPKRRLRSWGSLAEKPKREKAKFQLPKIGFLDARKFTEEARKIGLDLRSEEHTSELQSRENLVCRLL